MIDLRRPDPVGAVTTMAEAGFPSPFGSSLEYAAPARGPWNIVHVGMLMPEAHQIFVCAQGCLRGVVLTAAEMGASDRFSTIAVEEHNLLEGDMEELMLDGVRDIIAKLPYTPRAILLFSSCVHHFTGCDLDYVFRKLRKEFPHIDFTDCYMTPILRKTVAPDAKMRQQLYSTLHEAEKDGGVSLIGSLFPQDESSDLVRIVKASGRTFRAITDYHDYDGFQQMAKSGYAVTINPAAVLSGDTLESRLGQKHLHLPLSYSFGEIRENLEKLCAALHVDAPDFSEMENEAAEALKKAVMALNGWEVSIDYTATSRPLGMARLLLEQGVNVTTVYADAFTVPEMADYLWLKEHAPDMKVMPTVHPKMGLLPREAAEKAGGKLLAIGQKAAYFSGTGYFVNLLEGGGHYGFDGIVRLCDEIREALLEEKDVPSIVQVKGWGCCG